MRNIWVVFKREVCAYFATPLAYVFIFIFLFLSMSLCFIWGRFLEGEDASLDYAFFQFHPWLFMILGPAIGMRLWSEEHRQGTIELLLTMPIATWQAITGKFLAACVVVLASLALTFPIVITVNMLGEPDMGKILSGYLGSFFTGCATIAITCCVSAFTRNQVTCLVVSVAVCFFLTLLGSPPLLEFLKNVSMPGFFRPFLIDLADGISLLTHSNKLSNGVLRLDTLIYFISIMVFSLFATSVIIRAKRA
ncbi:MAG: ABC transporter permease subunit [Verrucomicrobiales bacterium]